MSKPYLQLFHKRILFQPCSYILCQSRFTYFFKHRKCRFYYAVVCSVIKSAIPHVFHNKAYQLVLFAEPNLYRSKQRMFLIFNGFNIFMLQAGTHLLETQFRSRYCYLISRKANILILFCEADLRILQNLIHVILLMIHGQYRRTICNLRLIC